MLKRAESAGAPAIVFTVDLIGGSNRETMMREPRGHARVLELSPRRQPEPGRAAASNDRDDNRRKPMLAGLEPGTPMPDVGTPTWDYIKRIRDSTTMKVFIKGIVTREDAELAVQHGASGVIVSNHGGRAENSTRATIAWLPEVVAGARGRIPVLVDGGIRRGTDVFKALALGATAVGHRSAVHLGAWRVRSGGRRGGAGDSPPRARGHDAAGGDGPSSESRRTTSSRTELKPGAPAGPLRLAAEVGRYRPRTAREQLRDRRRSPRQSRPAPEDWLTPREPHP